MQGRLIFTRSLSLTIGTTAVTCFVAAGQVWQYPYPRSMLGNIGLALLASTFALVMLSVIEAWRCEGSRFWTDTGRPVYTIVLAMLTLMSLWGALNAIGYLHVLWPCFEFNAPEICSIQAHDLADLDTRERQDKVRDLMDSAGRPAWYEAIQYIRSALGMKV